MTDLLKKPIFLDETAARDWLEARVWADGRVCPHCGNADQDKITKLEGKAHRPGVYQCNETECRQQFTVTVNTVFERSKIPLTKWLAALFLMTASKKGISAHQVHRMLGISYKSTWFLMHRLREAMRTGGLEPLGGEGKSLRPMRPISANRPFLMSPRLAVIAPISRATRTVTIALSSLWSSAAATFAHSMSPLPIVLPWLIS
jgi:transposase-like protein